MGFGSGLCCPKPKRRFSLCDLHAFRCFNYFEISAEGEPRAVTRVRDRRSVIRVRADETAIRVRIVARPTDAPASIMCIILTIGIVLIPLAVVGGYTRGYDVAVSTELDTADAVPRSVKSLDYAFLFCQIVADYMVFRINRIRACGNTLIFLELGEGRHVGGDEVHDFPVTSDKILNTEDDVADV